MNTVFAKLLLVLCVVILPCGCQRARSEGDLAEVVAEATEEQVLENIEVPDGDPEELFQFMLDIEDQELGGIDVSQNDDVSHARYVNALRRIMTARVEACEKILAATIEPETKVSAIRMKLDALRTLSIVDANQLGKQYEPFVDELIQGDETRLVNLARASLFQAHVHEFLTDADADGATVTAKLDELLAHDDLNEDVFVATRDALVSLFQNGHLQIASQGFKQLGISFKDHESAQVAEEADSLLTQAVQLELNQDIDRVLAGEPDSVSKLLEALTAALNSKTTSEADRLAVGVQTAQTLEFGGQFDAARQVYAMLQQRFAQSEDPQLTEDVNRTVQMASRRLDLMGETLQIDGVLFDGEPFVWKNYRGEHVIVCFWTSWDSGWPDQVRRIRQVAAPYRDQGLKFVTINLNDDRNALERYLQSHPLSWPIVVESDFLASGFENRNAVRCGVEAVPFMLLVDPDGKVLDIHLLGDRLQKALEQNMQDPTADPAQQSILKSLETHFIAAYAPESEETDAGTTSDGDQEDESSDAEDLERQLLTINPYAPPAEAAAIDLITFIMEMQDKPRSIQGRPGFSEGVILAVDRILEMETKQRWKTDALLAKFQYLQRDAALGNEKAEASLRATIEQWKNDERPKVSSEIRFLQLEQRAQKSDELSPEDVTKLITDLHAFFEAEKAKAKHLRLASLTVRAINQLEDGDEREKHFDSFGALFGKSDERQIAAYGRRIAGPDAAAGDLIDSKLELSGVTTAGAAFNWESYRGRWVVVDFWATWCGPCRRAMPELRKLAEQYKDRNLEIVGVSLDEDLKALAEYLGEENLPWTILAGPETNELAKKYGVRGIPQLFLVDGEGTIRYVTHRVDELAGKIAKELP